MKNTRKLIPAVVMLLISAVLMSTASFAWFSMNKEVTATGMSVTATTPASLEIATDPASDWSYGVTLSKDVELLNPITRHTDGKWYVPASDNTIGTDGKAKYALTNENLAHWTEVVIDYSTGKIKDGATQYALTQDLYIRTNAGNAGGADTAMEFKASATVSGTSTLLKSVKVYLVVDETVTALNSTPTGDWTAPLSSSGTGNYIKVTVVVVYDGEALDGADAVVKNDNADLVETAVSVVFTAN